MWWRSVCPQEQQDGVCCLFCRFSRTESVPKFKDEIEFDKLGTPCVPWAVLVSRPAHKHSVTVISRDIDFQKKTAVMTYIWTSLSQSATKWHRAMVAMSTQLVVGFQCALVWVPDCLATRIHSRREVMLSLKVEKIIPATSRIDYRHSWNSIPPTSQSAMLTVVLFWGIRVLLVQSEWLRLSLFALLF